MGNCCLRCMQTQTGHPAQASSGKGAANSHPTQASSGNEGGCQLTHLMHCGNHRKVQAIAHDAEQRSDGAAARHVFLLSKREHYEETDPDLLDKQNSPRPGRGKAPPGRRMCCRGRLAYPAYPRSASVGPLLLETLAAHAFIWDLRFETCCNM